MHHSQASVGFKSGHSLPQLAHLGAKKRDLPQQLSNVACRRGAAGDFLGVRRQERRLPLVADNEAIRFELPHRFTSDRDGDLELRLELGQRRQAPSFGELPGPNALAKLVSHLLVGGLAGPLNHLHPTARIDLCPIVPKRYEQGQCH